MSFGVHEHRQQLTDRPTSIGVPSQRHVKLNPVAIATAVLVLQDVASGGEVGDNARSVSLGDAQDSSDVANSHAWIVCDADKDTGVVGEETPFSHEASLTIQENIC